MLATRWFTTGICVDKIERDDDFWRIRMELILSEFYIEYMVPEIVNPRYLKNKYKPYATYQ
jgi:hypothetical protein